MLKRRDGFRPLRRASRSGIVALLSVIFVLTSSITRFGVKLLPDRASWYLEKYVEGTRTTLLEDSAYDVRGQNTFQVNCQGPHFTVFLNGAKKGETDDSDIANGDIGFFVVGVGDMTEVTFTNLQVSAVP
jgi:hypothetical protein